MAKYFLTENEKFSTAIISDGMFGTNFVTTFDFEFTENSEAVTLLNDLGVSILRFPGGSVTEEVFADLVFATGNWGVDSYIGENGNTKSLTTLGDFFDTASAIQADVQLVIPTRVAFEYSAGQALLDGTFGERRELDSSYFKQLNAYIDKALAEAVLGGVEITKFEIGNEFWGSGQMNASEYGYIASVLTEYLSEKYPDIDVIVQIVSSANQYSPLSSRTVYLEPTENGDYVVHNNLSGDSEGWIQTTIPASGNATTQTRAIAEHFKDNAIAADNLDGIVEHVYFDGGFDDIDGQRDFSLLFPHHVFMDAVGLEELDFFVTEWSPRNPLGTSDWINLGNASGLHYAHTTLEAFFELVSNGVDGANFWPLTFGNPSIDSRVLIDSSELDLTFGGTMFQMLSASTAGKRPILDYEIEDDIDIHGFSNENSIALFVSERGGSGGGARKIEIDLQEFSPSQSYFVTVTVLGVERGSFYDITTNPRLTYIDGYVQTGETLMLELAPWEIAHVELQNISHDDDKLYGSNADDVVFSLSGDDIIYGEHGNDRMSGGWGNDKVTGGYGNDILFGSKGNDQLYGGFGNDKLLGGYGNDRLSGGSGNDIIVGEFGDDVLFGSLGNDRLYGSAGRDHLLGGIGEDNLYGSTGQDKLVGGDGDDKLLGGRDADRLFGEAGSDSLYGGFGNDKLHGGLGSDKLVGNSGADHLYGEFGNDILYGCFGNDKLSGNVGDDKLVGGFGNDILYGGGGQDRLYGDVGSDILFGNHGDDILYGGGGEDIFVFRKSDGHDLIVDFENGVDLIEMRDAKRFSDLTIFDSGDDVVIEFGNSSIQIGGSKSSEFTADDFLF